MIPGLPYLAMASLRASTQKSASMLLDRRQDRTLRLCQSIISHKRSVGTFPRCSSTNLNLIIFGSRRTLLPFLGYPSPPAVAGFLCEARQSRAPDRFALLASQDSSCLAGSSGSVLKTQPQNQPPPIFCLASRATEPRRWLKNPAPPQAGRSWRAASRFAPRHPARGLAPAWQSRGHVFNRRALPRPDLDRLSVFACKHLPVIDARRTSSTAPPSSSLHGSPQAQPWPSTRWPVPWSQRSSYSWFAPTHG